MGIAGRNPKQHAITRNPRLYEWTSVENVPNTTGPRLPPRRHNGEAWPAWVRARWQVWSRMPHTRLWQPADWDFALDCAELLARAADGGASVALWSEIRLRERAMATTFDSRQSMRIRYVTPATDGPPGPVSRLDDYRNL
jgi:hypothetical protein